MEKHQTENGFHLEKPHSIYKYVSFERASDFLEKSAFNFSCPLEFNDPFDCNPSLIELDDNYVVDLMKEIKFLDEEVINNYKNDPLLSDLILYTKHKAVWDAVTELLKRVKITCFSKKKHNLLMWSHYSRNHTGLCLEFDANKLKAWTEKFLPKSPVFLDVTYTDIRENILYNRKLGNDQLFTWLKTKSKDWDYEEEVRLVWMETEQQKKIDRRIPVDALRHVYLGNRMKEGEQNQIVELCKKTFPNAIISKAYLSSKEFRIEEKRLL